MDINTFKELLSNLHLKCQAEVDELRNKSEVSVTGFFKVVFMSDHANVMVRGIFVCAVLLLHFRFNVILHEDWQHMHL